LYVSFDRITSIGSDSFLHESKRMEEMVMKK